MSRQIAVDHAAAYYDAGAFLTDLSRRVGHRTESQEAGRAAALRAYLDDEITGAIAPLGFATRILDNAVMPSCPFLLAERIEDAALPTVLIYGHGDVIRGYDAQWRAGLSPWHVTVEGDRLYGRGTADNKGQHTVNLGALAAVLAARAGRLGFNTKLIIESGEEMGSPGLREVCAAERAALAADLLIASDGPRVSSERPTLFLGSRGAFNFDLTLALREGAHHSGNWGGLLRNPGTVLANAVASLVDGRGRLLVEGLRPPPLSAAVKAALADITVGGDPGDPVIDADWGEPGLSAPERVFGWNSLEVLAFRTGNPDAPANAIPAHAFAHCQLRFVVGCDPATFVGAIRDHLDRAGFPMVAVKPARMTLMNATRLDPTDPWVTWALASLARTTGKKPALLPNLGGSLPNDIFADLLGLPTLWVPHSYPSCSQHAPDEHMLGSVAREGLRMMAGLFWDLGDEGQAVRTSRCGAGFRA